LVASVNRSLVCVAPIVPTQSAILTEVNSTFVTLAMDTWQSGGCPVESFDVALQVMGDKTWHTVENSIPGNSVSISSLFTVLLKPAFSAPITISVAIVLHNYHGKSTAA